MITEEWLLANNACEDGIDFFLSLKEDSLPIETVVAKLIEAHHEPWANWLITHKLNLRQKVEYAIYAANSVIGIFEREYPDDSRPMDAIVAAQKWLFTPTDVVSYATFDAADNAASDAVHDAHAAAKAIHEAEAACDAHAATHYAAARAACATRAAAALAHYAAPDVSHSTRNTDDAIRAVTAAAEAAAHYAAAKAIREADAACDARSATAAAHYAARDVAYEKIFQFGLSLLKKGNEVNK